MRQLYYALLTLLRGRGGNLVKLLSLTLGLTAGVLLFSQIAYELRLDTFYDDPERLVLLRTRLVRDGVPEAEYNMGTFRPAAADLWEALPDLVESACLSGNFWQPTLYVDDKKLDDMQVMFADTLYFGTLELEMLKGDPHDLALQGNAFLSESKARELFGDEDPVGRELSVDKVFNVTVRGVYRDLPGGSLFPHDAVLSLQALEWGFGRGTWGQNNIYYTIFRLKPGADAAEMNRRVQQAVQRYTDTRLGDAVDTEYSVIPLPDIYLSLPDSRQRLTILFVLGFSIFFVSILNYVLMAVAGMSRRAKAVGVHKCCGAGGSQVLGMFLWETALLVLASVAGGWLLIRLFADPIEEMLGTSPADLFRPGNLGVPLLTVVLLFVVAGVLPGVMYARIPVTQVFRRYTEGKRGWKRGLLFVQFAGATFILGLLLTVVCQYRDLMNRPVGFRSEGLAVGVMLGYVDRDEWQGMADALRREPYVESVAGSGGNLLAHYSTVRMTDVQGNFICPLHYTAMSLDFPQVSGLKLVEGAWPKRPGEAVVGRHTVETLKWEAEGPLDRRLPVDPASVGLEEQPVVTGVVDDVRNMGFFMEQTCTAFILSNRLRTFNVRLKEPVEENLRRLNAFVHEAYPKRSLEFETYTDVRRGQNEEVLRFRNTVCITSACILLIVLMGLIGYVSDETSRRSKEIAVRKVNGAEALGILRLLAADILRVSVGAVLVGVAAACYASALWMEQFADSAMLSPLWYVVLCLGLLALIVLAVTAKAWRIANENPVVSLRSE